MRWGLVLLLLFEIQALRRPICDEDQKTVSKVSGMSCTDDTGRDRESPSTARVGSKNCWYLSLQILLNGSPKSRRTERIVRIRDKRSKHYSSGGCQRPPCPPSVEMANVAW